MPKASSCPVCKQPVGTEPHEACFEKSKKEQQSSEAPTEMLCPACGKPMINFECQTASCEMAQPD